MDNQAFKIAFAGFLLQKAHGRAFDVEAAHGFPPGERFLRGRIILRRPGSFVRGIAVFAQVGHGVTDHSEASVAQQVDLHKPGVLHAVLVPLEDFHAFCRALHGNICINGPRRDHHPARMNRKMTGKPGDAGGNGNNFRPRRRQVDPPHARVHGKQTRRIAGVYVAGGSLRGSM